MAPIIPDPNNIRAFKTAEAFEKWLSLNHDKKWELWLKIHKKDSGLPSVTAPQALDIALCWGWIDGIRKSFDADSFLQRYTPRKAKSIWSQVNRENAGRLTKAGRMTPHGQRQVEAAKTDGRWAAAYAPIRSAPAGRARKIATLVEMLARGETIVPESRATPAAKSRIASLGGHARRESLLAARRIAENFQYLAVVRELRPAPPVKRLRTCRARLPGPLRRG